MLQGRNLFEAVAAYSGAAAFWWLGQHQFILKLGRDVILIDPYLDPHPERRIPPLFQAEDAAGIVNIVCCTHQHEDHMDPKAISGLVRATDAIFVAPRAHSEFIGTMGVKGDRLVTLNDGESARLGAVTIHGIKAQHEFFDRTADGLYPYLGYLIEGAGKLVYHAGDTLWWEGLQARLSERPLDVAMVPINGRDARRYAANCIGCMTYQEATDLVGGLEVRLIVPAHYDMFASNSVDVSLFVDYMKVKYPGRKVWVGAHTECVPF
jgi:L-ascorbate metabolism protein UlaG (beta-lactamase superfamily)